jgi:hypothetical protein
MTVPVIKIVLQTELPFIRHNLLYEPGLKKTQYMYCIYMNYIYHVIICKLDKTNARGYNWTTLLLTEINTGT